VSTDLLTTREAAALLGVGTTSVKRWADSGLLRCVKTPGGHRRFPRDAVGEFIRTHGEPAALDDHMASWMALLSGDAQAADVIAALQSDRDEHGSWWQAADALGAVLEELGRRWEAGAITVLQEHLASERFARAVAECAQQLPVPATAPSALLLAAQGDDHTLGLSLAELCLREAGWNTRWAGRRTPLDQAAAFVERGAAQLVAMSASVYSTDTAGLSAQAERIGAACRATGAALLLGGAGLWPAQPHYGHRLQSFEELHHHLAAHVESRGR